MEINSLTDFNFFTSASEGVIPRAQDFVSSVLCHSINYQDDPTKKTLTHLGIFLGDCLKATLFIQGVKKLNLELTAVGLPLSPPLLKCSWLMIVGGGLYDITTRSYKNKYMDQSPPLANELPFLVASISIYCLGTLSPLAPTAEGKSLLFLIGIFTTAAITISLGRIQDSFCG